MKPTIPIKTDGAPFGDREFPFTPDDFKRIAAMLYEDAGIALSDVKAPLVYSRLVKRLRALGIESFRRYCDLVSDNANRDERGHMTAALTTNVTRFFREPHHFEHLRTEVLPGLLPEVRRGGRLRIWSAGCSTGEEPYSIALTILSLMPDAAEFDVKVLATDVNANVLAHGREAVYGDAILAPVNHSLRGRWFTPAKRASDAPGSWRAGEALRKLVAFRELNLHAEWPMRATYQAIFCRNVVIYFDEATRQQVWRRMTPMLAPGGRLYVGHSERVLGVGDSLEFEHLTTYRRVGGAPTTKAKTLDLD